jgi:drug/metabolite transporter (DMT)-like permease
MTLGLLNCVSYLTLTIGLQTVNASRAAFIAGTNVIFIALLGPLFRIQRLSKRDIFSALICCFGIYMLTGCELCKPTIGDGWVMMCAFFIAITIIYVNFISKKGFDPLTLVGCQVSATALFSMIPCVLFSKFDVNNLHSSSFLIPLLYCSICATILTFFLQVKYLKYLSPQKVGLIFCLEPLFAAFFDWIINGTGLHFYILVGGFFILLSIVMQELQSKNIVSEVE